MRRGVARLQRRIVDLQAYDPTKMSERHAPEVRALSRSVEETLAAVFGHDTVEYGRYEAAANLSPGGGVRWDGSREPVHAVHRDLEGGKRNSLALLGQAIRYLEEEIAEVEQVAAPAAPSSAPARVLPKKVFVVHGHDEAALQGVARFLEKLDLEAIVLREQPDQGRTVIEKFEHHAAEVGFAVVLLTPDDVGSVKAAASQDARARQNVVFELGYFAGHLGRGRTCLMRKGDVEIPSDLYGVIYTDLDANGAWRVKLVQEMKAAGLDFDANRMLA